MTHAAQSIVRPGYESHHVDPDFPNAPVDWTREMAEDQARREHLTMTEEHWQMVCALQEFYARHDESPINVRELHDALDEFFHPEGGLKYLYRLFPEGPISQGCRLAGLEPPAGAQDRGFGSVI